MPTYSRLNLRVTISNHPLIDTLSLVEEFKVLRQPTDRQWTRGTVEPTASRSFILDIQKADAEPVTQDRTVALIRIEREPF